MSEGDWPTLWCHCSMLQLCSASVWPVSQEHINPYNNFKCLSWKVTLRVYWEKRMQAVTLWPGQNLDTLALLEKVCFCNLFQKWTLSGFLTLSLIIDMGRRASFYNCMIYRFDYAVIVDGYCTAHLPLSLASDMSTVSEMSDKYRTCGKWRPAITNCS